jgi:NACHT domain
MPKVAMTTSDHEQIKALNGEFGNLKADFDRAVNVTALTLARKSGKYQSSFHAIMAVNFSLDMAEESELLKRLEPVKAANYQEKHSCMEGTRETVLNDIFNWAVQPQDDQAQPSAPNVFWLYGMPGLGKTFVANSLCDRLRRSKNLGGSFFCKYDNSDLREPTRVLPTLIAKLALAWGPFRKIVAKVLLDQPQINPESTRGELLLEPLRLLKTHPSRPLVLVIDAIDECGQPDARIRLLTSLMEACSLVPWLKIVVTSRPERDIQSFFEGRCVICQDLATEDPKGKDICHFTQTRMAAVASARKRSSDWPGAERVNKIAERSGGLFMFVNTLALLVDVPEPEPLLAQVLGGESPRADTPTHNLYSMVLRSRISQPTQALHSIIQAIIAVSAHRPLPDTTLATLLSLEPQVVREWVDELSSLFYRDTSEKGGIRVRHLSILEFLQGDDCPPEFRVDLKMANSELAACCLRNMGHQLQFNICGLETSYLSNSEVLDLDDRVEQKIPDALQYSCMHWSDHLCCDVDPISQEITTLLDNFLPESQLLYWLEVMSLMGKAWEAILALHLMRGCDKVCVHASPCQHQLMIFLCIEI